MRLRLRFDTVAALRIIAVLLLYLVVLMLMPGLARGAEPAQPANLPAAAPSAPASAPDLSQVGSGSLLFAVEGARGLMLAPNVATTAKITVNGLIARARVSQTFRNPSEAWVEGIYVFPLPEQAAVDHMEMRIGERVIEGRIEEREEAHRIYQMARAEGRRAGLVEEERPNIFTASVANIGPGEEIVVSIDYQERLRYDQGAFALRFPMVVGPRYIPGQVQVASTGGLVNSGSVPDAERITPPVLHPDFGKINPVALTVELNPGFALAGLESPYHPIEVTEQAAGRYRVTLKDGAVPADRDFALTWKPALGAAPAAAVFTEAHGGGHYLLAMVLPPAAEREDGAAQTHPREAVFIIDVSGSMAGRSIVQAKEALLLALDRLQREDRFNIIAFNNRPTALFANARRVSARSLDLAGRFVRGLEAEGGTEMAPALELALQGDAAPGTVRQVVFLTDGAVGNEVQLFRIVLERLGNTRLFPIGIGSAPNGYFMTKAAEVGRGGYTYIGKVEEVRERMAQLFEKLESPVLTDLKVDWSDGGVIEAGAAQTQSAGFEIYPPLLPDLYSGEPVVFTARVARLSGVLTLSGRLADRPWRASLDLDGGGAAEGVAKLWAADKIDAVMNGLHEGADPAEVQSKVTALALAHRLVTRYTSLVAVDVTPARPKDSPLASRHVPTNLPEGWVYEKVFGPKGERAPLQRDAAAPLQATKVMAKVADVRISSQGGVAMPQTATAAPLHALVAVVLLVLGLLTLWLRRRWA
jgi:Ca-activated chloride channel family protein